MIDLSKPESESNRTFPVRVRFGSTEFLKGRFGFGSVRFKPNRTDKVRFEPTKIAKESCTLAF